LWDEIETQAFEGEYYNDGDPLPAMHGLCAAIILLILLLGWFNRLFLGCRFHDFSKIVIEKIENRGYEA